MVKNITFVVIAVASAIFGMVYYFGSIPEEASLGALLQQFGIMLVPMGIHLFYYFMIRGGNVPQSRMTYFWARFRLPPFMRFRFLARMRQRMRNSSLSFSTF